MCPEENITLLNRDVLDHYVHRYYRPDRITIAGANVDHDELVKYCEKHFDEKQLDWYSADKFEPPDLSIAQYTGGILKVCLSFDIGHGLEFIFQSELSLSLYSLLLEAEKLCKA